MLRKSHPVVTSTSPLKKPAEISAGTPKNVSKCENRFITPNPESILIRIKKITINPPTSNIDIIDEYIVSLKAALSALAKVEVLKLCAL